MFDPTEFESSIRTSLTSVGVDIFGVLSLLALATAAALTRGKDVLLTILVALYPAALITQTFPYYGRVSLELANSDTYERLIVLLISSIIIFTVMRKYLKSTFQLRVVWRFVEALVLAVSITGLFLAVLFNVVNIATLYSFSVVFYALFATPVALFGWLLVPIVSIPLFVRP